MRKVLGLIFLALYTQFTQAQGVGEKQNILQRFAHWRETCMMKGIDTAYIRLPEKGWAASVSLFVSDINLTEYFSDANSTDHILFVINSGVSWKPHLSIAYRGLELGYGYDVAQRYNQDLRLQLNGKRFGGEFNYLTFNGASTFCTSDLINYLPTEKVSISAKRIDVNAYYVFNTKTSSYPAGIKQTFFQKKSSGSVVAGVAFFHTNLRTDSISVEGTVLQQLLSGEQHVTCNQIAIGTGYAYNYIFRNTPLLFHASIMPMLSYSFGAIFHLSSNDNVACQFDSGQHHFGPTIVARGAISYALSDDILLAANINYKYYRPKLSNNMAIPSSNIIGQAYVIFRF